jgi:hypothetical protein
MLSCTRDIAGMLDRIYTDRTRHVIVLTDEATSSILAAEAASNLPSKRPNMTTVRAIAAASMIAIVASTSAHAQTAPRPTTAPAATPAPASAPAPVVAPINRQAAPTASFGRTTTAASPAEAKQIAEAKTTARKGTCDGKGGLYRWVAPHNAGEPSPAGGFFTSTFGGGCRKASLSQALASGAVRVSN